jgi:hypothetical protein
MEATASVIFDAITMRDEYDDTTKRLRQQRKSYNNASPLTMRVLFSTTAKAANAMMQQSGDVDDSASAIFGANFNDSKGDKFGDAAKRRCNKVATSRAKRV